MPPVARWAIAIVVVAYSAIVPAPCGAQGKAGEAPGASVAGAAAPHDSAKAAVLRQLLARTQAADQAIALMEASLPAQRQSNPRIPAVFWDRFIIEARARRGELVDMISVVYDRHFTIEELRQLLAFYDTPLGRKLLAAQPAIAQESVQAGQQWGQRIGVAIGAQLAAEGLIVTP